MKPNHYAVAVGIDRYPARRPDKPLLQYARNDATAFYEWLTSPVEGGVPPQNAKLITATNTQQSNKAERPVRIEVIDFLKSIHKRVHEPGGVEWPESRLYIYLAGHGVAPDGGRGALLFADFDSEGEGRNMIVWNWGDMFDLDVCGKFYERCPFFNEIVLFGDFCRDVDSAIPPVGNLTFGCYKGPGSARIVTGYGASMGHQSGEPEDVPPPGSPPGHMAKGFFTRAVLEGLRPGGAKPHPISGIVDLPRLKKFVTDRVADLSRPVYQEPTFTSLNADDLVLARHEVPSYPVDLLVPDGFPEPIKLILAGEYEAPDRWEPGDSQRWRVRLPAGFYQALACYSPGYRFADDGDFKVKSSPGADGREADGEVLVVRL